LAIRVLFIAAHLGKGGGVALQAYQLFAELQRHIDIQLLCLDAPGPHQALNQEPGVIVPGPLKFPGGIATLRDVLRSSRNEYDLFQAWDAYFTFPAAYLARVFPRVTCLGTDPGFEIAGRYGGAAGAFTRAAMVPLLTESVVVVNSQFLASRFQGYRPRIIPNGLNVHKFEHLPTREEARRRFGLPTDRTLLVTVGKVIPEKRLEWLLEVLRRVPQTTAVIVGGLSEEHYGDAYYRQLLEAYSDVRDRALFVGEVPWDHVPWYLTAADMFVFPSPWEGSPNAVLEAMAAGTPAVVSDIPPHREILVHGRTGLIAPDVEAMARSVETLVNDPRLAREIGSNGRAHVFDHYSFEACAQTYLNLYRTILAS
jgi:glycosyltransferase involved in cell wall biosynthesis